MITAEQIQRAKVAITPRRGALHEHDDCIRIAYEWLDAQVKTKGTMRRHYALKHIIESWAQRYVSTSDVIVAASMHPDIRGEYPYFNISSRLTRPSPKRLIGIGEAGKHENYASRYQDEYVRQEDLV